jgi:hypothetical protein
MENKNIHSNEDNTTYSSGKKGIYCSETSFILGTPGPGRSFGTICVPENAGESANGALGADLGRDAHGLDEGE